MTGNDSARPEASEERPNTRDQRGHGRSLFFAGGALCVLLAAGVVAGGVGVANAISTTVVQASAPQASPTTGSGAQTPEADPSTPPDRGSDQTEAAQPKDTVYNIQAGDTLTSISAKLGVGVDAIAAYNAVRDVDVISSGSVLRVPFIYVPPAADANG